METIMEYFGMALTLLVVAFGGVIAIVGSIVAAEESALRKRQMREGTHDYYGNKLDESEDD